MRASAHRGQRGFVLRRRSGFTPIRRARGSVMMTSCHGRIDEHCSRRSWWHRSGSSPGPTDRLSSPARADTYVETWFDWTTITVVLRRRRVGRDRRSAAVRSSTGESLRPDRGAARGGDGGVLGVRHDSVGRQRPGFVVRIAGLSLLRPTLVAVLLAWPTGRFNRWEVAVRDRLRGQPARSRRSRVSSSSRELRSRSLR